MTVQIYLGLGANIDPEECLQAGVRAIRQAFTEVNLSPVYQAPAINIDGPDFLNMVVSCQTDWSLSELNDWINMIEQQHGRDRSQPQPSSHRLDIDVLLYGDLISPADNIPRTDIMQRAYVLRPLAKLAPQLVYPGSQKTILELWQQNELGQPTQTSPLAFD